MSFRFSGHETFPFRYAWLPKAFRALDANAQTFADEEAAIVTLGVGKNMVRAIRFWVQATGIAEPSPPGYTITDFGRAILNDGEDGHDPYLEDVRTLWLLHWHLATQQEEPLFAWHFLLNQWQHPEISRTEVLRAFRTEVNRQERKLSDVTLQQHFDTFLHTYVPTRGAKGDLREDNLDSPLVELEIIQKIGERKLDKTGKREAIYAFRREAKPEITPELFHYCLDNFWQKQHPHEKSLTFRAVAVAAGSPGQIFKLPEPDIRERLVRLATHSHGHFQYQESSTTQQITRSGEDAPQDLLASIYKPEVRP
ncbi:MAG: DUF4007 family protein [Candidatus Viridilinea halotolerans]|uniref:DUF4007 family protein n=1 Tax=Candidatus Viridilinea halotolerans TaxID=2491704 RepID=A0A426U7X4_9CHLR|nr:MAG: DUF4007 family protein [Candidatus Viridilinea halotolerans]